MDHKSWTFYLNHPLSRNAFLSTQTWWLGSVWWTVFRVRQYYCTRFRWYRRRKELDKRVYLKRNAMYLFLIPSYLVQKMLKENFSMFKFVCFTVIRNQVNFPSPVFSSHTSLLTDSGVSSKQNYHGAWGRTRFFILLICISGNCSCSSKILFIGSPVGLWLDTRHRGGG